MKRLYVICLTGFVVLNAAGVIFLYRRLSQTESTVAESIMKNIEERQQIEESIRRDLDLKRREKEFILIQDQERQAQEVQQQLNELKIALELGKKASAESARQLEDNARQLEGYVRNLESGMKDQHQQYRLRLDQSDTVVVELKKQLEAQRDQYTRDLKRLEDSYAGSLAALGDRLAELNGRLSHLATGLSECQVKLDALASAGTQQGSLAAEQ